MHNELALDFDDCLRQCANEIQNSLYSKQIEALKHLEIALTTLGGKEGSWTNEALESSPEWKLIRNLAAAVLLECHWHQQSPPAEQMREKQNVATRLGRQ